LAAPVWPHQFGRTNTASPIPSISWQDALGRREFLDVGEEFLELGWLQR
jgi:hypothetical protein